jgi:outer membrane lipoprotein-sorting protein
MAFEFKSRLVVAGTVLLSLCGVAGAQESANSGRLALNLIVDAVEKAQSAVHPQFPYQVLREYRLSGSNSSNVVVEVNFRPPTSKDYRIQRSSGSKRGEQVVRNLLDHEVDTTSSRSKTKTAITRENYDFAYIGDEVSDGQACYVLEIKPKRKEKDLIAGKAWIDKRSFLVRRIEGEISKTPSWWLKKVRVKLSFGDYEGTWLQSSMEAVADVRIVGLHTLTSQILDYRGTDEVASAQNQTHSSVRRH